MIEADAPILFTLAFLFVTMCFVILIVTLYRRKYFTKKSSVALFLIYWAFTTLAFFQLIYALRPPQNDGAMQTENITYMIGWAGIYWVISVIFLGAGLVSTLAPILGLQKKGE